MESHRMSQLHYKDIFNSLIIFFLGYILEYFLNAYVASHISPALYGDFSLALKLMMLAGPLYLLGMPSSIIKYVSKFQDSDNENSIIQFLKWAVSTSLKTMIMLVPFFAIMLSIIFLLDHYNLHLLEHHHAAVYFQFFTPFISGALFLCAFLLVSQKILSSNIAQQLIRNISFIICFSLLFSMIDPEDIRAFHLALCIGVGSLVWLVSIVLIFITDRNIKDKIKHVWNTEVSATKSSAMLEWSSYGKKIAINTSLYALISFLDLLIIEIIPHHGDHNVGYYSACLTIASLIFITKKGVFQIIKPHMASVKDSTSMQLIINKAFTFLAGVIFLESLFVIVFSTTLLSYFGPSYIHNATILRILIIGYSVSIIPSLSVFYLLFHGFEKVLLRSSYAVFISTLLFGSLAYYLFGLIGIAIAISLILVISAYILFFFVKTKSDVKFMIIF